MILKYVIVCLSKSISKVFVSFIFFYIFCVQETTLKRPPNPFELFVYTHTKNHDETTFIDKKAKTIHVSSDL